MNPHPRSTTRSVLGLVAAAGLLACAWTSFANAADTENVASGTPAAVTPPASPNPSPEAQAITPAAGANATGGAAAGTPAGAAASAQPPTPNAAATATANAKSAAAEACKKAIAKFGSGDASALKSLPAETRSAIEKGGLSKAAGCLAAANDNEHLCDSATSAAEKDACYSDLGLMRQLKSQPKGASLLALFIPVVHKQCKTQFAAAACDSFRDAVLKKDAAKCKEAPESMRQGCAALVAGDPSMCPKGDNECVHWATNEPKFRKDGFKGMADSPAAMAFATGKRDACAPLLSELESSCSK